MLGAIVAALALAVAAPAPTDDQLAGARVITGFEGRHPPPALRRMIEAGQVSGVILFDENGGSRRAVRRLTSELQSIPRPAAVDQPLLVTVDQEGGLVRRLPGPPKPAARAIGGRGAGFAERIGRATGESLQNMGVNVDLAPVLDLGRRGGRSPSRGAPSRARPRPSPESASPSLAAWPMAGWPPPPSTSRASEAPASTPTPPSSESGCPRRHCAATTSNPSRASRGRAAGW